MKTKGIYFLYRLLQAFGLPALLLYFLFRGLRNRGYWHSLPQRFGFLPRTFKQTGPGAIWLHAVSVGEVLSCLDFLRRLREEFPRSRVFVSTSTLAGHATATQKLSSLADGVFFAPVDYVFAVRRVLRTLQPAVMITAETEIWPNLFREVKRTRAALTLVNGRISDRAFPRYRPWRGVFAAVMPAIDSILVQSKEMAARFVELGAPAGRVRVTGNFKYDFEARALPPESPVRRAIDQWQPSEIWVAASTTAAEIAGDPDEDDAVIAAFQQLLARRPGLLLILAPRKPERFDVAAGRLDAAGLRYVRRSKLDSPATVPQVLLLDSIGELGALFSVADVVFMGGTLAHRGGHNILEPALFGKPVVAGPHLENFQAIADDFRVSDALVEIAATDQLAGAVETLLSDPVSARAIGERGLACAQAKRGASAEAVLEVRRLHRVPVYRPAMPWYAMAWLLSRMWERGSRRRLREGMANRRRLTAPVISIGNLTMGGTGKTPCVLRLAELLHAKGRQPGILMRGYGRQSPDKVVAAPPGQSVPVSQSGDEAQIFLHSGLAPVGIGNKRYDAGKLLIEKFGVDVLLLDDGFQHVRLDRDLDIVLIDALQPFGGGHAFPTGRLREPLSALSRAGVVLLTRCDGSDLAGAITNEVRRWNSDVPVFESRVRPVEWVEYGSGRRFPLDAPPFGKVGGFCGLGNPASFRRTLESLGVQLVDWLEFTDHHRYRSRELRNLGQQMAAHGATALLTTEKDSINLCDASSELLSLPLYWLRIGIEIDREAEFLDAIGRALTRPRS